MVDVLQNPFPRVSLFSLWGGVLWKTNPVYLLKSIQQEYREYSMLLHDLKKWM